MEHKRYYNDDIEKLEERIFQIEDRMAGYPRWLLGNSTLKRAFSIAFHYGLVWMMVGIAYMVLVIIAILLGA